MISAAEPAGLRSAVAAAAAWSDRDWYHYTLNKDFYSGSLSAAERTAVIDGSVRSAYTVKRRLAPEKSLSPAQYCEQLGLAVVRKSEGVSEGFLCMGLYEPKSARITLYEDVMEVARDFICANGLEDLVPVELLEETTLYHELFHAMEEGLPDIYTRSQMLTRRRFGLFEYQRGIDAASEIGAVHFSKLMSDFPGSPCIYELCLLWATGQLAPGSLPNFENDSDAVQNL